MNHIMILITVIIIINNNNNNIIIIIIILKILRHFLFTSSGYAKKIRVNIEAT